MDERTACALLKQRFEAAGYKPKAAPKKKAPAKKKA
jgi:hypothetical protein